MKVVCTELGSKKGRDKPGVTRTPPRRLTRDQDKMLSIVPSRERGKGKSREKKKRKEEHEDWAQKQNRMPDSNCPHVVIS